MKTATVFRSVEDFGLDQDVRMPGWRNFEKNVVLPEEWGENFRMSRDIFLVLCDLLRPWLARQTTNMRRSISVEKQVAVLLYFLSDEGRYRKTANAFGIAHTTVSNIVRTTCLVIRKNLDQSLLHFQQAIRM